MLICGSMPPERLLFLSLLTSSCGFNERPAISPLINTMVPSSLTSFLTNSLIMSRSLLVSVITPKSARYFLRPMFTPSGVSSAHSLPQCVACKARASKCSCDADRGEITFLRCAMVLTWFVLSRRWQTPVLPPIH